MSLLCSCKIFAIGMCAECEKPICGDCSTKAPTGRLCRACVAAEKVRTAEARVEEATRKGAAREKGWRDWEDHVVAEIADAHPVERLIRFLRILTFDELASVLSLRQADPRADPGLGDEIRGLLPSLWSGDLLTAPPWDHEEVHTWLSATTPPSTSDLLFTREQSSSRGLWSQKSSEPKRAPSTGWIVGRLNALTDGRRGVIDPHGVCSFPDPPPGFNVYAMWELGDIARLPDLPRPAEPNGGYGRWRLWGVQ